MIKVLLVEDNELNRELILRRLIKKGYEVDFAANGKEAIEKVKESCPDLILMDMDLPEINGWEATSYIRNKLNLKTVPIVAISAHAMTESKEKALEAGCNEYIFKPIDFKLLFSKINEYLKKVQDE